MSFHGGNRGVLGGRVHVRSLAGISGVLNSRLGDGSGVGGGGVQRVVGEDLSLGLVLLVQGALVVGEVVVDGLRGVRSASTVIWVSLHTLSLMD